MRLAFDVLGVPFKLDTFNHRLAVQKVVYLAQAAGIHLGYDFHWYLRGPYSPDLTRDVFAVDAEAGEGTNEWARWQFDDQSKARLEELSSIVRPRGNPRSPADLERLASVHYVISRQGVSPDDHTRLAERVRALGKRYDQKVVSAAVNELSQCGLLKDVVGRDRSR